MDQHDDYCYMCAPQDGTQSYWYKGLRSILDNGDLDNPTMYTRLMLYHDRHVYPLTHKAWSKESIFNHMMALHKTNEPTADEELKSLRKDVSALQQTVARLELRLEAAKTEYKKDSGDLQVGDRVLCGYCYMCWSNNETAGKNPHRENIKALVQLPHLSIQRQIEIIQKYYDLNVRPTTSKAWSAQSILEHMFAFTHDKQPTM